MGIIIIILLVAVLIIIALYLSLQQKSSAGTDTKPVLYTSGIYSIVRKSPREAVLKIKPQLKEVAEFVQACLQDINGNKLSEKDRKRILEFWQTAVEKHISYIEECDQKGNERFLFRGGSNCGFCRDLQTQNIFITREDIYHHPEILPPFFPGCDCRLQAEVSWNALPAASPLIKEGKPVIDLPHWKNIKKT